MQIVSRYIRTILFLFSFSFLQINLSAQTTTEYLCTLDGGTKIEVAEITTTVLPNGDVHTVFITSN